MIMKCVSLLLALSALELSNGFVQPKLHRAAFGLSVKNSRLEGNTRDPSSQDIAIMDEMITKLAKAPAYELPNAVKRAFRVISSPRFFMRIAERSDIAQGEEKEMLSALASNLVITLEAVVETTEERLDERAKEVEKVLKAAAEPETGEFLVPLLPLQVEGMRKALESLEPSSLDAGFLSTVDTWMNKSQQDGIDGMVSILQRILQMYSGTQILRARAILKTECESTPAAELFETLLKSDSENWDATIKQGVKEVETSALVAEVQRTMEVVVLGLDNGSMAQRVQAEYLRELVTRIEAIKKAE
jgi:hypothetical protein